MQLKSHQISCLHRKLLHARDVAPINVQYTSSNTLYDYTLNLIDNLTINFSPYSVQTNFFDPSILFINDPVDIINKEIELNNLLIDKIIFFHNDKLLQMKKEDLFLFKRQIAKYTKFTFDNKICNFLEDAKPISYGFKPVPNIKNNREKSVVFLGNKQNIDAIAYNNIKNRYPDADFFTLDTIPQHNLINTLSSYKICISMHSLYNSLLAASCGCFVVSAMHCDNIPLYSKVSSFDEVLNKIQYILANYNDAHHQVIANKIFEQYDYEIYTKTIQQIVANSCNKVIHI